MKTVIKTDIGNFLVTDSGVVYQEYSDEYKPIFPDYDIIARLSPYYTGHIASYVVQKNARHKWEKRRGDLPLK
jgi:hypothetical protein